MNEQRAELIADVAETTNRLALHEYPRRAVGDGRCIMTTSAALDALRYFGVAAEPVVVGCIAGNRAWRDWYSTGDPPVGEMPETAWSVGISQKRAPEKKPGIFGAHLVVVADGDVLLDLDAAQSARPGKGIVIPEVVIAEWLDDEKAALDLAGGGVLVYLRHEAPPPYRHAVDWSRGRQLAGRVIREVRARHPQPGVLS